jgi:hypothetical protein
MGGEPVEPEKMFAVVKFNMSPLFTTVVIRAQASFDVKHKSS